MSDYTMTRMSDILTRFDDVITSSCYILEGAERYALIDTGACNADDFRQLLRNFEDKPMVLLVTHAHADHYANAGLEGVFEKVYMHPDDIAILPEMNSLFAMSMEEQGRTLKPESVTPLREGDKIELGGLCIEVIELPGHTPGSICFIERSLGLLFTGDSVGSGGEFWMQLPFALTISQLRKNLGEFMEKLPENELTFLGGHFSQAGEPGTEDYNPVNRQTVKDLMHLCDSLLSGARDIEIHPYQSMDEIVRIAAYRNVRMVYRPERV